MAKANIHDPGSIERVYPPRTYAGDAAQNGTPTQILKGVRILRAPDASGNFELEAATQQVGESPGAVFLAPQRHVQELAEGGRYGGPAERAGPAPAEGYQAFLNDIVAAAKRLGEEARPSPGPGDARLRGLRQ